MGYCIDTGSAALTKHGEELCGDSIEILKTDNQHIIVVADGLGSGVKANILSRLTVKTASTMMKLGGRVDEVMETLAQTLPICKVRKLAYSTFTILQVSRDGTAHLIEYENPLSFIGRGQELLNPQRQEKVIDGKVIRESFLHLQPDDWLVIVTDGVLHAGVGKVWNLGWGGERVGLYLKETYSSQKSAAEWAREIARLCNNIYGGKPGDDASIAVVKVRQPRNVTVLIGPPKNQEDDALVVDKLMRSSAIKVVCGGTTGNVVARVLGKEVHVDLTSASDRVPPTAIIPGIDLVTEGAITLVDVLELFKSGQAGQKEGRDGATRLAAVLAAADNIHFIIGTAANKGLEGPGMPAIYVYKQYIIRDLIRILRELGKNVTEEYY